MSIFQIAHFENFQTEFQATYAANSLGRVYINPTSLSDLQVISAADTFSFSLDTIPISGYVPGGEGVSLIKDVSSGSYYLEFRDATGNLLSVTTSNSDGSVATGLTVSAYEIASPLAVEYDGTTVYFAPATLSSTINLQGDTSPPYYNVVLNSGGQGTLALKFEAGYFSAEDMIAVGDQIGFDSLTFSNPQNLSVTGTVNAGIYSVQAVDVDAGTGAITVSFNLDPAADYSINGADPDAVVDADYSGSIQNKIYLTSPVDPDFDLHVDTTWDGAEGTVSVSALFPQDYFTSGEMPSVGDAVTVISPVYVGPANDIHALLAAGDYSILSVSSEMDGSLRIEFENPAFEILDATDQAVAPGEYHLSSTYDGTNGLIVAPAPIESFYSPTTITFDIGQFGSVQDIGTFLSNSNNGTIGFDWYNTNGYLILQDAGTNLFEVVGSSVDGVESFIDADSYFSGGTFLTASPSYTMDDGTSATFSVQAEWSGDTPDLGVTFYWVAVDGLDTTIEPDNGIFWADFPELLPASISASSLVTASAQEVLDAAAEGSSISTIDSGYTNYGWLGSDLYGLFGGGQSALSTGTATEFLVNEDGFGFEGRAGASETLILSQWVRDVDANFNESTDDMDLLVLATESTGFDDGIWVDMSEATSDSGDEFQVSDGYDGSVIATVSQVEAIVGTSWNDQIYGDLYQNVFIGGSGDDRIYGSSPYSSDPNEFQTHIDSVNAGQITNIAWTSELSRLSFDVILDSDSFSSSPVYDGEIVLSDSNLGQSIHDAKVTGSSYNSGNNSLHIEVTDLSGQFNAQSFSLDYLQITGTLYQSNAVHADTNGILRSDSEGIEWLVGGTGFDYIEAGALNTVIVDFDDAELTGGYAQDTFVVRGAQFDKTSLVDQLKSDSLGGQEQWASINDFQISSDKTSLGGNLGLARDIITFNVPSAWFASVVGITETSLASYGLDAYWGLSDGADDLTTEQRGFFDSVRDEFSVDFLPNDVTENSPNWIVLQGLNTNGWEVGAFAELYSWIAPEGLTPGSTFGAVLLDAQVQTPVGADGSSIMEWMRVNDATLIDIEVLDQVRQTLSDNTSGTMTAEGFADLVESTWGSVAGEGQLSHVVSTVITNAFSEFGSSSGTSNSQFVSVLDDVHTGQLFQETINLSFAIEATRANTVRGLSGDGILRFRHDMDTGDALSTIFTPGSGNEKILGGRASDRFEFLRQDFNTSSDSDNGSFGQDIIIDFAARSANDTARDLLLIEGVESNDYGIPVVHAERVTLGDNVSGSSLKVSWAGDPTNPGGEVLLYRQYDPTTDRYRVEDVQLGGETYSLGETDAIRDINGNISGAEYSTYADQSLLVGIMGGYKESFHVNAIDLNGTSLDPSRLMVKGFDHGQDVINLENFDPSTLYEEGIRSFGIDGDGNRVDITQTNPGGLSVASYESKWSVGNGESLLLELFIMSESQVTSADFDFIQTLP